MESTDLPTFIRSVGVDKAAKLFGEKRRTVMTWMYRERRPRVETAHKIVDKTRGHPAGSVSLAGIYGNAS